MQSCVLVQGTEKNYEKIRKNFRVLGKVFINKHFFCANFFFEFFDSEHEPLINSDPA